VLGLFADDWKALWDGRQAETFGSVYTRSEIVSFMLDLAGFVPTRTRLSTIGVLEPGCGDGAFLTQVVERIVASEVYWQERVDWESEDLDHALTAVDIDQVAVDAARKETLSCLESLGCPSHRAADLSRKWVVREDFLLAGFSTRFGLVVGNPPYVRIEELPKQVLAAYRAQYETLTDRADLYIAFFERGLSLLAEDGQLSFITANRFAKNQYGAKLRRLISEKYFVKCYLNLEHTQPFEADVAAYPAITVLARQRPPAGTCVATLSDVSAKTLEVVLAESDGGAQSQLTARFESWFPDGAPWIATNHVERLSQERLASLPKLEQSADHIRVGIGVATGADKVFVLSEFNAEIEPDRQIPLALSKDVSACGVAWSGHQLINPFAAEGDGGLVDLRSYPGLLAYLERHEALLRRRYVARKPSNWYRTIDRVWPDLVRTEKLLLPDIQQGGVVAFDDGEFYPHHNLYFVVSQSWSLRALQAILRSSLVTTQVAARSVQMRGGSIRYQAQVLREVRIPLFGKLRKAEITQLEIVAQSPDQDELDGIVGQIWSRCL